MPMDARDIEKLVAKAKDDIIKEVHDRLPRKVGVWLRTEYDTAVIRAHAAADWQEFERNKDIFPNLRWMPTTSPEPESTHAAYWRMKLTLPVDDPFWNEHHPGDRWNCKCSLEATDEPVVRPAELEPTQPQRGLENNPGKDGHTFSDKHPYFPKDCNHCPVRGASGFTDKLSTVFSNQKKHCFNCQFIDGCLPMQKRAVEHIKKIRQNIHPFEGDLIEDKGFLSGRLRVFRGSLDTVYSHAKEDGNIIKWLKTYSKNSVKGWKYEGWAPNRPYSPDNPHFDPKNPDKKKHPDTKHFLYYSLEINGKKYWANVKQHNLSKSEVLYTIEKNKPGDIKLGLPPN